jgi:hypothetical protein
VVTHHVVERRLLCKLVSSLETKPGSHPFLWRMRVALLLLIPLTACLDATTGNVGNAPAPTAARPREAGARREFSTGLTPPLSDRKPSTARTFARGTVQLKLRKDSTLEYHLNVFNPGTENFTAAHIYRSGRAGPPVVTLFAGATLKDKYIQVRGTGILLDPAGKPVLEELRSNPTAFYVSLRTAREPQGALLGTIQ